MSSKLLQASGECLKWLTSCLLTARAFEMLQWDRAPLFIASCKVCTTQGRLNTPNSTAALAMSNAISLTTTCTFALGYSISQNIPSKEDAIRSAVWVLQQSWEWSTAFYSTKSSSRPILLDIPSSEQICKSPAKDVWLAQHCRVLPPYEKLWYTVPKLRVVQKALLWPVLETFSFRIY